MSSIALIGPDGAGKSTVIRLLVQSPELRARWLYMGVSIPSSNVALPTSRLAEWLKTRSRSAHTAAHPQHPARRIDLMDDGGSVDAVGAVSDRRAARLPTARRRLRAAARLANRLAEEWYRQLLSWFWQLRGYVVLYDRHYVFDFAPEIMAGHRETLEQRLHRWALTRCYPRPDLVVFLDAPGDVLFARKGELTVAELEKRRQAFLQQGERLPNFVRIDATQPLAKVHDEVLAHVLRYQQPGRPLQVIPS